MDFRSRTLAEKFAYAIIRSVARILLPKGIGFGSFSQIAKYAFVRAAADQIDGHGGRASSARVAALTGLSRQDVARLRWSNTAVTPQALLQRTERVMHGWFNDARYLDASGQPRALPIAGENSFTKLVREYSGDIPRKAVLDELVAGAMVVIDKYGEVQALRQHHAASKSDGIDLECLAADAGALLNAAADCTEASSASYSRIGVQFPEGYVPAAVTRIVAIRTERFLEALADYLHAESAAACRGVELSSDDLSTLIVLVATYESTPPKSN